MHKQILTVIILSVMSFVATAEIRFENKSPKKIGIVQTLFFFTDDDKYNIVEGGLDAVNVYPNAVGKLEAPIETYLKEEYPWPLSPRVPRKGLKIIFDGALTYGKNLSRQQLVETFLKNREKWELGNRACYIDIIPGKPTSGQITVSALGGGGFSCQLALDKGK